VLRGGGQFSPFGHRENALRLGFASLDVDEIRRATQRLAQAASDLGSLSRPQLPAPSETPHETLPGTPSAAAVPKAGSACRHPPSTGVNPP